MNLKKGDEMQHNLKIHDNFLRRMIDGRKKVLIIYNDSDYQVGDILNFKIPRGLVPDKLISDGTRLTQKYFEARITHIYYGQELKDGYVALSLESCGCR